MSATTHHSADPPRPKEGSLSPVDAHRLNRTRYLVELQGFTGLDDATVLAVAPWLRLSPALCVAFVVGGLLTGRHDLFLALLPFAIGGTVLPYNPIDAVYNLGIRHFTRGPAIPTYGAPRRFACFVAAVWVTAMWFAFHSGMTLPGNVLGVGFVAVAGLQVFTGFCLPSFTFRRLRRLVRR